jgi:predicted O-methyltransferase YrrM
MKIAHNGSSHLLLYCQGALPSGLPNTVHLEVGLFEDTLPSFLDAHPESPIRFMNIDCDTYSSTKTIFDNVYDRIVVGTIIHFDEYTAQGNWEDDEYKAFQEAVEQHDWKFEYLAISLYTSQTVVRITETKASKQ